MPSCRDLDKVISLGPAQPYIWVCLSELKEWLKERSPEGTCPEGAGTVQNPPGFLQGPAERYREGDPQGHTHRDWDRKMGPKSN